MTRSQDSADVGTYLNYRHLDVHFIYGFLWRSEHPVPEHVFADRLPHLPSAWHSPFLHERVIGSLSSDRTEAGCVGAYQPTFVLRRRCLEASGLVSPCLGTDPRLWLVVPLKAGVALPRAGDVLPDALRERDDVASLPILASWTLRLFDTGTGTFTVRIAADCIDGGEQGFRIAHWLLHLAPSVDTFPEEHPTASPSTFGSDTDCFLFSSSVGAFRLFDFHRRQLQIALQSLSAESLGDTGAASASAPFFRLDERGLARPATRSANTPPTRCEPTPLSDYGKGDWQENQAPFAFITAVVDDSSLARLREPNGSHDHSREIASLCTRVAFSNAEIQAGYDRFSSDSLHALLRYDGKRLLNLCRDTRLFAAFCRRGAIALTADPNQLPAVFYLPSLLNLFELLRARLHGAVAVGARLGRIASRLSVLDTSPESPIDEDEYARLHQQVVANLQDPLQYLFDGGSLTDLATEANSQLFVTESWNNVQRAFEAVDRLVSTWEAVRFRRSYGDPDAD